MEIGDIYMVRARHSSSVGPVVHHVGGVKCQPFLKCSKVTNTKIISVHFGYCLALNL